MFNKQTKEYGVHRHVSVAVRRFQNRRSTLPECERFPDKKQYETEWEAQDAATAATKREGVTIRYYMCSDCNQYHLSKRQQ
jgi:hypothetical protein